MGESMSLEGATDALAFETYVEHFLAPSLREGQVVVLDRLGAHTGQRRSRSSYKREERILCSSCPPTRLR
jgi:hypothetical protein